MKDKYFWNNKTQKPINKLSVDDVDAMTSRFQHSLVHLANARSHMLNICVNDNHELLFQTSGLNVSVNTKQTIYDKIMFPW